MLCYLRTRTHYSFKCFFCSEGQFKSKRHSTNEANICTIVHTACSHSAGLTQCLGDWLVICLMMNNMSNVPQNSNCIVPSCYGVDHNHHQSMEFQIVAPCTSFTLPIIYDVNPLIPNSHSILHAQQKHPMQQVSLMVSPTSPSKGPGMSLFVIVHPHCCPAPQAQREPEGDQGEAPSCQGL